MSIQITLCVLLILGFAWLLWMLSCTLLTPVRSGRDARITLVVQARGGRAGAGKSSARRVAGCARAERPRRTLLVDAA